LINGEKGKEPVMFSVRHDCVTVVVSRGMSAGWGRCWPLLGQELEADAGSRHWM